MATGQCIVRFRKEAFSREINIFFSEKIVRIIGPSCVGFGLELKIVKTGQGRKICLLGNHAVRSEAS